MCLWDVNDGRCIEFTKLACAHTGIRVRHALIYGEFLSLNRSQAEKRQKKTHFSQFHQQNVAASCRTHSSAALNETFQDKQCFILWPNGSALQMQSELSEQNVFNADEAVH